MGEVAWLESANGSPIDNCCRAIACTKEDRGFATDIQACLGRNRKQLLKVRFSILGSVLHSGATRDSEAENSGEYRESKSHGDVTFRVNGRETEVQRSTQADRRGRRSRPERGRLKGGVGFTEPPVVQGTPCPKYEACSFARRGQSRDHVPPTRLLARGRGLPEPTGHPQTSQPVHCEGHRRERSRSRLQPGTRNVQARRSCGPAAFARCLQRSLPSALGTPNVSSMAAAW